MTASTIGLCAEPAFVGKLPRLTRAQADLLNFYSRSFRGTNWQAWIKEAFAGLFERPVGTAIHLSQTNEIEPQEKRQYCFEKPEILIGRSTESDVVLGVRAIGKQHARIFEREGDFYLEDLGSSIGTWVGRKRLTPGEPHQLLPHDRFLAFPYTFVYEEEALWEPADDVEIECANVCAMTRAEFVSASRDPAGFDLAFHVHDGRALIQVDRMFLVAMARSLTRGDDGGLVDGDREIFEFIAASVVERLNRELQTPLQCSLRGSCAGDELDEAGVTAEAIVRVAGSTGRVRLFLPEDTLRRCFRSRDAEYAESFRHVTWRLPVSGGFAEVGLSDLSAIEPGDILTYTQLKRVLLPKTHARSTGDGGWPVHEDDSNPRRLVVENYFERNVWMENAQSEPQTGVPDLNRLPVRVDVVLGHAEMTLADLKTFAAGSIVEIDRTTDDPVQIYANGKSIGSGRLVEVDGMLGVQISEWSAA